METEERMALWVIRIFNLFFHGKTENKRKAFLGFLREKKEEKKMKN